MLDWKSPDIIAICAVVFNNVSHVWIGAYLFEALQSLGFEWSVITGRRKFTLPMLLYFYTKWMLFAAFVGMLIAMNTREKVNCQALYTFNQVGGHSAIGGSTLLLMLRSLAIHKKHKWIKYPYMLLGAAHIGILAWGVTTVKASWVPSVGACVVQGVGDHDLAAIYFVTLANDTIVMIVTMAGLSWSRGHTGLWNMVWDQGVIYFVTAVIANLVPAVVLMVDLNPVMNIIFSIPAIATTATVSTRCFVRLSEYANRGDETASGIWASLDGAKPWAKRIAGPTCIPGPGIVHPYIQPVQFTRQGGRPLHINNPGATRVVDIAQGSMSQINTLRGCECSSSHFAPYSFNDDKFGKPRPLQEPKDFV